MTFVCCVFIESAIDGRPIDGTVIDVVLVLGAILTCFFGVYTLAYDFFMAFDLREIGETLAVFRSIFLPNADGFADDDGNASNFMAVEPFCDAATSPNTLFVSSFCCVICGIPVGRTTIFAAVWSFRRLGSAFTCVLKKPVILVCDRIFGVLPLLTLIPEVMVAEDLDPLLFCILVRLFVASVSVSDV